jgi:hypothetical protein
MAALSVDAITRASARIALLFCGTAVLGLPFALRDGWQLRAVLVLAMLAATLGAAVQVFVRRAGPRWAALLIVVLCLTTALVSACTDVLRPDAAHQIVSWTNAGVGGALAFMYGGRLGTAVLVVGMASAFGAEHATGGQIVLGNVIGPFTYVAGSTLARGAAFRGDAATESALSARESAEGALRVAEQRWEAARTAQRQLHDTVLATLTMLAHRGEGVPAETVIRACVRDAELLRHGVLPTHLATEPPEEPAEDPADDDLAPPAVGAAPGAPVPSPPAPRGPLPAGALDTSVTVPLRDEVEAAIGDGRATGFDVRVHAAGRAYDTARLAAPIAAALRHALRECLWNARQHSGVHVADVTVIVDDGLVSVIVLDEGRGFDPASVPEDRLGLRDSVSARLADVGGQATVWSGNGLGTSVLLTAPVAATAPRRIP